MIDFALTDYRLNCGFAKIHLKYLGHVVGSGKLSADHDKVAAVADWQPPTYIKGMQ